MALFMLINWENIWADHWKISGKKYSSCSDISRHQVDQYFLVVCNELCFHIGYVTKIESGTSHYIKFQKSLNSQLSDIRKKIICNKIFKSSAQSKFEPKTP